MKTCLCGGITDAHALCTEFADLGYPFAAYIFMDGKAGCFVKSPAQMIFGYKKFFVQKVKGDIFRIMIINIEDNGLDRAACKVCIGKGCNFINQVQDFY